MKTKKVKIAVFMDDHGSWVAGGWDDKDGDPVEDLGHIVQMVDLPEGEHIVAYWVTAYVPIPSAETPTIEGHVVDGPPERP